MRVSVVLRRIAGWNAWRGSSVLGMVILVAAVAVSWAAAPTSPAGSAPARWVPSDAPNRPIGQAQGIFPGRVVWIHNPKVAKWTGDPKDGGWYEDRYTDAALAEQMLRKTLARLTGAKTDAAAWDGLFRQFNRAHGRGDAGYRPGEKVTIKLNMNCSHRPASPTDGFYNTPQLTRALLRQLVKQAGVREEDIIVYDASRLMSDAIFLPCHAEFPGVRFEDRDGGDGRHQVQPDKRAAVRFADPNLPATSTTYLPTCVTRATYLINAAVWKGHSLAGITLCAKNHYGSLYREDTGPKDPHKGWNPGHLHRSITSDSCAMGTYHAIVDLMAHKDLGGKTILYLIDALYAAPHQSVAPQKWLSPPFNGHWTASVFASQDPVALESVAVDFFAAEPTSTRMVGSIDNYLHEAALANQPPSATRYDPEGDGTPSKSLGVHEHWNSPEKKQYSRNLGTGAGIELVVGE